MRAVVYLRVSTNYQAENGYSIDMQRRSLTEYCIRVGHMVTGEYVDEGISGKNIENRPAMRKMLDDIESYDIIVIWALSRLTRSVADLYNILEICSRCNVSLVSITESFDTSSPMGRAMIGMIGVFAQMEREITGERVAAAMLERAMQGKRTTSGVLGYDSLGKDSMVINQEESEIVLYIFKKYIQHKSLSAVAELCNILGYRGKRRKMFKAESIKRIITRPIYIGYYTYKGKLYKGNFETFVPESLYKRANCIVNRKNNIR